MPIQPTTPAPQLQQVYSPAARKEAGVSHAYGDTYNDAMLAKYNNDYNYWLWRQQADYNSPASQVQRAKEAGLNPNMVAGNVSSGNLNSTPDSRANFKSSGLQNQLAMISSGVNMFNSVISAVKEGIDMTSELSGIPNDISLYRKFLNANISEGYEKTVLNNILTRTQSLRNYVDLYGANYLTPGKDVSLDKLLYDGLLDYSPDKVNERYQALLNGPFARQQNLRNSLMELKNELSEYDLQNLKPAELERINKTINNIISQTSVNAERSELLNQENQVYKSVQGSDVVSQIGKLLLSIFKN